MEDDVIEIQSRSMSDPSPSDNDFKNEMGFFWTTLKNREINSYSDLTVP